MNYWILVLLLFCCSSNSHSSCGGDCRNGHNRERSHEHSTSDCGCESNRRSSLNERTANDFGRDCDCERERECKIEPRPFISYQGNMRSYENEERDCGCENNCR